MMMGRIFVSAILASVCVSGADCVSSGAGDWTSAGTWTACGGGFPGIGDTAQLNHSVVVDTDVTMGQSPGAGGFAIVINATGRLVLSEDQTLVVRGGIQYVEPSVLNARIEMLPGSRLHFDPSQAASRTTAVYTVISAAASAEKSILEMMCTNEKRCEVKTLRPNGDEARTSFQANGANTGQIEADYVDFEDLGDASNPAIAWTTSVSGSTGFKAVIQHSSFNRCGYVGIPGNNAGTGGGTHIIQFNYNRYVNGLSTTSVAGYVGGFGVKFSFSSAITGVGVRELIGNYMPDTFFGGGSSSANCRDIMLRGNVLRGIQCSGSGQAPAARSGNLLFRQNEGNTAEAFWPVSDDYIRNEKNNPKNFTPNSSSGDSMALRIIHDNFNGEDGDLVVKTGGANANYSVVDNIVTSESDVPGENGAALLTLACSSTTLCGIWTTEKNSIFAGGTPRAHLLYFESTNQADRIVALRSNAIDNVTGGTVFNAGVTRIRGADEASSATNIISPGGTTHNGHFGFPVANQPANSNHGTVYFAKTTGATPGAYDVNESAKWVDPYRNLHRWIELNGGAGTTAGAKEWFGLRYAADPMSMESTIQKLHHWVRQGFAPRNLKYATGGHDGGRIGAVPPVVMFGMFNGGN